jgi:hypothetical protein
MHWQ